jgi:hypothetical protein
MAAEVKGGRKKGTIAMMRTSRMRMRPHCIYHFGKPGLNSANLEGH